MTPSHFSQMKEPYQHIPRYKKRLQKMRARASNSGFELKLLHLVLTQFNQHTRRPDHYHLFFSVFFLSVDIIVL